MATKIINLAIMLDVRVTTLINAFEENGWKSQGSADVKSDWWFEDIIELISEWRPVGTKLYLTLLTEPQIIDRKEVWAINITSTLPTEKHFIPLKHLTLNDIKRTDLSGLVKEINSLVLK